MTSNDRRMTHRERVLAALSHRQPDRVPIDLGSTVVTGIAAQAYDRLKSYLGLDLGPTRLFSKTSQIADIDLEVRQLLGIDTWGFLPGFPDDRPILESDNGRELIDEWGVLWCMPPSSNTYCVANKPMGGSFTVSDIRTYPWPDPDDPGRTRGLRQRILDVRSRGDWAIVLSLPTNFILTSQNLRGFSNWMIDTAINKKLLSMLMDQVLEIQMAMCENVLDEVGDIVDVVVNLDDLALQDRLMISPKSYQQLLEPRLERLYEFVRDQTDAKILHHTDGAVAPLLGSLIDMGIDAVNPLQISAKGMDDIAGLKAEFGDRLAFWGGIDTQHLLPFGTPEEVRVEVRRVIDILNVDGGYVLNSVHNIQAEVPTENIVAMLETALGRQLVPSSLPHAACHTEGERTTA